MVTSSKMEKWNTWALGMISLEKEGVIDGLWANI